jgi:glycerate 2-kinase
MFVPSQFQTYSLKEDNAAARVLDAVIDSVEPGVSVANYLNGHSLPVAERLFVFGLGKAACAMTQAVVNEANLTENLIVTKHASLVTFKRAIVLEGNHPIPGKASLMAGEAALKFVSQLTRDDLLLCLISGGGSALMTAPYVPLSDLQDLTSVLLACGARIDEINILRRHLDKLKGGGLLRGVHKARVVSLLLSDVVGDSIEAIASGPTAPDPTTRPQALSILEKYDLKNNIPKSIIPSMHETLKPNDPIFNKVQNVIIASNEIALLAAETQARKEGFQTRIIQKGLQGEARKVGLELARQFKDSLKTMHRPFCLLAGGETTVALKGAGKGGRNQELALAAVDDLAGLENIMFISVATDGEDGPTDAAGAVVTGESARRAESLGMTAADYLSRNDAYSFFDKLNDLIRIGPSGTNVNDLVFCFAF